MSRVSNRRSALTALLFVLIASIVGACAWPADPNQLPPAKQAVESAYASLQASGKIAPMPKGQPNPNPDTEPTLEPPAGGTPAGDGILFSHADTSRPPIDKVDVFTNAWSVFSSTSNVDVWAEARGADSKQGFVMVVIWNHDRTSIIGGGSYDTPRKDGAVRIAGAAGRVLRLQADDGAKLSFDTTSLGFK